MVREHTGFGWGDPLDPTKTDVWLCNGYVLYYHPNDPNKAELWTAFGRADSMSVYLSSAQRRRDAAVVKARNYGRDNPNYRPWYADNYPHGDWEMHSRFD